VAVRYPRVLSLCSGVGGLDLGVSLATGGRTVCYVEREAFAASVLVGRMAASALDPAPVWDDLKTFGGVPWRGAVDLVCAGFPCFTAGTSILTEAGYRPIEQVAVGDRVLSHRGGWCAVRAVGSRGTQPVRRIRAVGTLPVTVTNEHPFLARRCLGARCFDPPAWVAAEDLTTDHFVAQVLPAVEPDVERAGEFGCNLDFWWLVGRYLADGWIVDRRSRSKPESSCCTSGRVVVCANHEKAQELRERIARAGFHAVEVREHSIVKFHIVKRRLWGFLRNFGRYAHGKFLPGWVFSLDRVRADALVTGYLTGDGCPAKRGWRASTVSKELALGIVLLLQRARGIVVSVRPSTNKRPGWSIDGRVGVERTNYIIDVPQRNRCSFVDTQGVGWRRIRYNRSVEGPGEVVYNLSVVGDESYVADGIVVHNCQPASGAGKRRGTADERWLWPDVLRVIRETDPRTVFLENVSGLLTVNHGAAFAEVVRDLDRASYRVAWVTLRASDVGAPHRRARVFILAHRGPPPLAVLQGSDEDVVMTFPPGPADGEAWQTVLEASPRLVPAVVGVSAPPSLRIDRLRAAGNGVVPLQAAWAYRLLALFDRLPRREVAADAKWPSAGLLRSGGVWAVDPGAVSGPAAARQWPTPRASEKEQYNTHHQPSCTDGRGHGRDLSATACQWPTPMAGDAHLSSNPAAAQSRLDEGKKTLSRVVEAGQWPTPKTPTGGPEARSSRAARGSGGEDLAARVQAWATPTEGDSRASGSRCSGTDSAAHPGTSLTDQVLRGKGWPTPAARDYRSPNARPYQERGGGSKGEQLPNFVAHSEFGHVEESPKRRLNPLFVEWLMGWPIGWTDPFAEVDASAWRRTQEILLAEMVEAWSTTDGSR